MIDIDGATCLSAPFSGGIIAIASADGGGKILPGGTLSFSSNLKFESVAFFPTGTPTGPVPA